MSEEASVISPDDVLQTLMNDGTIDAIRLKIITQLKANEELKNNTIKMVEQSKVLNTPGAEKQTKRELFDALRQELESSVLEKASKSVWEIILDQKGIGKDINETVEKVFCRLSGREPPLFPSIVESGPQAEKEKTNEPEKEITKEKTKEKETETKRETDKERPEKKGKEKENSDTIRKRKYIDTNTEEDGDEGASRSSI
ncbi:hypothetical protein DCAR_0729029 [Daucus carota subsp. sativus]|uniref:Uncharacterized protein n=1 Tax=Daucus carota subsp. sativus TaxID=79200 RepID=A0AAF0XM58_DAUCS|nr:hypothetical protein DCAR_0729029 [Daucus carota subsp. sativus]